MIGPTDPNRLMWMSGSLGAHSADKGGPVLTTYVTNRLQLYGTLDWPTMPEVLTEHGVSWKVYQDPVSNTLFNVLDYFKGFTSPSSAAQSQNATQGLLPIYPVEFQADVVAGTLPQGVVDPAAAGELRAPGGASRVRRVSGLRHSADPAGQPGGLGQDGVPGRLRRERRVLRPRGPSRPPGRR